MAGMSDEGKRQRRRRQPEEAREEILDAAERLIAERGPDGVSVQAVARAVGVSHGLVLHYFGTYEDLVRTVLQRRNRRFAEALRARLLGAQLDLGEVPGVLVELLRDPLHARLLAWAALGPQGERLAVVKNQLGRAFVDALHGRVQTQGKEVPRRTVEQAVLVAVSAALGYGIMRSVLLPSLGLPVSAESDEAFLGALRQRLVL